MDFLSCTRGLATESCYRDMAGRYDAKHMRLEGDVGKKNRTYFHFSESAWILEKIVRGRGRQNFGMHAICQVTDSITSVVIY